MISEVVFQDCVPLKNVGSSNENENEDDKKTSSWNVFAKELPELNIYKNTIHR